MYVLCLFTCTISIMCRCDVHWGDHATHRSRSSSDSILHQMEAQEPPKRQPFADNIYTYLHVINNSITRNPSSGQLLWSILFSKHWVTRTWPSQGIFKPTIVINPPLKKSSAVPKRSIYSQYPLSRPRAGKWTCAPSVASNLRKFPTKVPAPETSDRKTGG